MVDDISRVPQVWLQRDQAWQRRLMVVEMRGQGKSWVECGRALGVSGQRAKQIYSRHKRDEDMASPKAEWLSSAPERLAQTAKAMADMERCRLDVQAAIAELHTAMTGWRAAERALSAALGIRATKKPRGD